MKRIAGLAVLAMATAGCSGGGADADGDGTITTDEVIAEMAEGPSVKMRPGMWETKMEYTELDLPGVPEDMKEMVMRRMGSGVISSQCLDEEDIEEPEAEFFGAQQPDGCEYVRFDRSGNRLQIEMTCDMGGAGVNTTKLDGQFGVDTYTLTIDGNVSGGPGGEVNMKGTISGKRIGDCE